jgi:hypothetical protein
MSSGRPSRWARIVLGADNTLRVPIADLTCLGGLDPYHDVSRRIAMAHDVLGRIT